MPIVVAYAERGIALQQALRGVLVVFVVATVILLPPAVGARCVRGNRRRLRARRDRADLVAPGSRRRRDPLGLAGVSTSISLCCPRSA